MTDLTAKPPMGTGSTIENVVASIHSLAISDSFNLDDIDIIGHVGWDSKVIAERLPTTTAASALPVIVLDNLVMVGPIVRTGQPGCPTCADFWRRAWLRQGNQDFPLTGPLPGVNLPHWITTIAAAAALRLLADVAPSLETDHHEIVVVQADGATRRHRIQVDPLCTRCEPLIQHIPRATAIGQQPIDPQSLRSGVLAGRDVLRSVMMDRRFGPVGRVWRDARAPFGLVGADVALYNGAIGEGGYGRSENIANSEQVAFAEAIERLCSATPYRTDDDTFSSASILGSDAIDIPTLGVHEPELYASPENEFIEFDPETKTRWVEARTFDGTRRLVPEHVAYWGLEGRYESRGPKFVFETSSGCALAASTEEAVLFGLLEVIERDSFLLHWYSGHTGQPIAYAQSDTPKWYDRAERIADHLGYRIALFDQTSELGVPVIAACVHRKVNDGEPYSFFAAGSHLDPNHAARVAIFEALTNAVMRARSDKDELASSLERAQQLINDPSQCESLRDHALMYQHPDAAQLIQNFASSEAHMQRFDERPWDTFTESDAGAIVETLGNRLEAATGNKPVFVDQTAPIANQLNLRVVKVIAPGTLPMTFGYHNRRTRGFPRLDRFSGAGLRRSIVDYRQPHPFP